jgi:hypothetical protein
MLTTLLIVVLVFVAIRWLHKKRVLRRIEDSKPTWAIGYALYHLCRFISRRPDGDEILHFFSSAMQKGLPDLNDITSQSAIVDLKAYANSQGELSKLNNPLVVQSLSQAVAVEARTAFHMATSRLNIDSYMEVFNTDMSDAERQETAQEIYLSLRRPVLTADSKYALQELLRHYLMCAFERRHGNTFFEYSVKATQELAAGKS